MCWSTISSVNTDQFDAAARAVLQFLQNRIGLGLWMVTRVEGDDWIVLEAADRAYGVAPERVFRWSDSFCSRMVKGEGPRIAPRSAEVPAYAEAPIGRLVKIGSYVGVPLAQGDGKLFGTLCGIDPEAQPDEIARELPMIELLGSLLSSILKTELEATAALRRAERAEAEAEFDTMTGIYNRRGWNRLLDAEEARCRRYGHPACVVAIDLDGLKKVNDHYGHAAGDGLICKTAKALRSATRESDVVARLGGDEFAVVGTECNVNEAGRLVERLRTALAVHGVAASFGMAMRGHGKGLKAAWDEADAAMYREKGQHKGIILEEAAEEAAA
jgi:diguanylate cyclase (GGDEF)-like protein